jgi:predicted O-methyltransferase YrrM
MGKKGFRSELETVEEKRIPSVEEIERFVEEAGSDDLPTFGGKHVGGIYIQQVPDEIAPAIHAMLMRGESLRSFLEIGSAAGGTAYLIHHYFRPETIVLIDTNQHSRTVNRPQVLSGIPYKELIGRSDADAIIAQAGEFGPYDLIHIDGDHLYPAVRRDVDAYLPFLSDGGFLMLHDSALPEWGVARVTEELKASAKTLGLEFLGDFRTKKHSRVLGVALFRRFA